MQVEEELIDALRAFAAVEREIVAHGSRTDAETAFAFASLRRDMVVEFARLRSAIEQDRHLSSHPDKMTQATRRLAAFRTANALNQANWPVIRVRDDPAAYRKAAQSVAAESRLFWQWIEQELGVRL